MRRAALVATFMVLSGAALTHAEDEDVDDAEPAADARCRAFAQARGFANASDEDYACSDLAGPLTAAIREGGETAVVPPWPPEAPGGLGTPAQLAAAPAITPVPLAGGAVSAVGSPAGPLAVAALSLNPATIVQLGAGERDARAISYASRFADVSVVLPFSLAEPDIDGNPLEFVGVRVRLNAFADPSVTQATQLARELREAAADQASMHSMLTALLSQADDVDACFDAVVSLDEERIRRECGASVPASWRNADHELREIESRIRRDVDRMYLGADLRYDYGDVGLTGRPEADEASSLFVALAFGVRFVNEPSLLVRLRSRIGFLYTHVPLVGADVNAVSMDAAGALELEVPLSGSLLRASLGLEGRGVLDREQAAVVPVGDIARTDYLDVRLGFSLPLADATSFGVDVSFPVVGESGVQVGVSGDFSLLLPRTATR